MENFSTLSFRKMQVEDVFTFRNWGRHDSILFLEYNFLEEREKDIIDWYKWKSNRAFSEYYVVLLEEKIIGYLSLKNINFFLKRGELGIVLDPSYINRGLGKKILKLFLDYLKKRKFKKIILFAASYNDRAIKVYKSLGFKEKYKFLMRFTNGDYDEENPDFKNHSSSFKIIFKRTFNYAIKMELDLERDWWDMFLLEKNKYDLGETSLENIFINDFMPGANGEFVKVYILGYKFARENREDITNEKLADYLGILESDVNRAWEYWQKMGIVEIDNEKVKFINLKELYINNVYNLKEKKKKEKGYSEIVENPTYANLLTRAEFLMREPIAPMKKIDIINWITSYNMPADLIEEAFFYTTEIKGIYNISYVEQVVRNWSKDNIRTMEDVEKSYIEHDLKYYRYKKVMRYIGVDKKFSQADFNIINSWFDEFNFSKDLILAACNRTSKISKPNVGYVDAILRKWKELNINSLEEIEEKDQKKKKRKPTAFHNFKQITDKYSEDELFDVAMRKQREGFKKLGVDYGTDGKDK